MRCRESTSTSAYRWILRGILVSRTRCLRAEGICTKASLKAEFARWLKTNIRRLSRRHCRQTAVLPPVTIPSSKLKQNAILFNFEELAEEGGTTAEYCIPIQPRQLELPRAVFSKPVYIHGVEGINDGESLFFWSKFNQRIWWVPLSWNTRRFRPPSLWVCDFKRLHVGLFCEHKTESGEDAGLMNLLCAKTSQFETNHCAKSCTRESCCPPPTVKFESPAHSLTDAGFGSILPKVRRWGFSTLGLILTVGFLALLLPLQLPPSPSLAFLFEVYRVGPTPI